MADAADVLLYGIEQPGEGFGGITCGIIICYYEYFKLIVNSIIISITITITFTITINNSDNTCYYLYSSTFLPSWDGFGSIVQRILAQDSRSRYWDSWDVDGCQLLHLLQDACIQPRIHNSWLGSPFKSFFPEKKGGLCPI